MAVGINQYDQPSKVQPKIEDVVLKLTDEDSRPAIAFDDVLEVMAVKTALAYAFDNTRDVGIHDSLKQRIPDLIDVCNSLITLFNHKTQERIENDE